MSLDPRDYEEDDWYPENDDYSPSERQWADRADYADELYERDEIDSIQRAEIRAGA